MATEEVMVAGIDEVAVMELKQISMRLVRMVAMLVENMTPDRATMLHNEFPISPTWRTNCQGVTPGQIHKGVAQAIVG
jgi:hypothetical protein